MTMIEIPAETVPEWLRATRGARGLSTREMGEAVGVSHATVSAWERGKGEPSVTQFILWCDATKQRPDLMIGALLSAARLKGLEPLTF
ncbi:helix-turn-helix transcriptional regulator [Microbacterium sp. GXF7504]